MRDLKTILQEQRLNLDNTQKAILASMAVSPTDETAYGVVTGARNSVAARDGLENAGHIIVDDINGTAVLTNQGQQALIANNLIDDMGELTEIGEELINRYRSDRKEWKRFESFKYLSSTF